MDTPKNSYIALLRGINVGGNNSIKMTELKACFEKMGFSDVVTYIQSGNVLFKTNLQPQEKLTLSIEAALSKTFNLKIRVVTVTEKQLRQTIKDAPSGFGTKPDLYRYDVIFLKKPLTPKEALKSFSVKEGVDQVYQGKDVIYFSRLTEKASQSRLTRIIGLPVYQDMTIRNWNTTTKLEALLAK